MVPSKRQIQNLKRDIPRLRFNTIDPKYEKDFYAFALTSLKRKHGDIIRLADWNAFILKLNFKYGGSE